MATNDVILLDAILERKKLDSEDIGDTFEKFSFGQILKDFDLTPEEMESGWVDGSLDGGIDGFYVFVNGRLVTDEKDFVWPKSGVEIQVYLITCKHHSTIQQTPLDTIFTSIEELFDLGKTTLTGKYSREIFRCREIFFSAYKNLALTRPTIDFQVAYASRGDTQKVGLSVKGRGDQIKELLGKYFSASCAEFLFIGASELIGLYREVKKFELDIELQHLLTANTEGYVVLAKLSDYAKFVSDEKGNLRRYLFDSNVRDFLGKNLVNIDINKTLENKMSPNFWWLNNGVTILATSASQVGTTLKLKDIQIVNGLQTTESIYRYFSKSENEDDDSRTVLIKVIISQNESVRDQVIRATNSQSSVEASALHATDQIQRSIEEILLKSDWYYERRTNFYKNEERPEPRIVQPISLARGAAALLLKNPALSSNMRMKHLRKKEAYDSVFSEIFPINVWPVVAALIKGSETSIMKMNAERGSNSRKIAAWNAPLAYIATLKLLNDFAYTHNELASLDESRITQELFSECWMHILNSGIKVRSGKVNDSETNRLLKHLISVWKIRGSFEKEKRSLGISTLKTEKKPPIQSSVSEDLIEKVNSLLPEQPWKPRAVEEMADKFELDIRMVRRTVKILIKRGLRFRQKDGVIYDKDNKEIMRDKSRFV